MLINMFRVLLPRDQATLPWRFNHFQVRTGSEKLSFYWMFEVVGRPDVHAKPGSDLTPCAHVLFDVTFEVHPKQAAQKGIFHIGFKPLDAPRSLFLCSKQESLMTLLAPGHPFMALVQAVSTSTQENHLDLESMAQMLMAPYASLWVQHNPQSEICLLFAQYLLDAYSESHDDPSHDESQKDE